MDCTEVYVTGNGLQGTTNSANDSDAALVSKYSPLLLAIGAALLIYLVAGKHQ
jgi:hypothetical protein